VETKQDDVPHRRTRKNGKHKIWDEQISQVCGLFGCEIRCISRTKLSPRNLWEIEHVEKVPILRGSSELYTMKIKAFRHSVR
jgi:hypothetical protein